MDVVQGMLTLEELRSLAEKGDDRHGAGRVHRPLRTLPGQTFRCGFLMWKKLPATARTVAIICSQWIWRWSRCPATRTPTGSAATAISTWYRT